VKKFTTAGPHDVRFRVFADNGCAGDTTKTINILGSPIANFGTTSPACSGKAVYFTDSSTTATGTITQWHWNFGDGTTLNLTNNNPLNHNYGSGGVFTPSLVVTSSNGCKSDSMKRIVTIVPGPTAKFGYDKNICVGDSIRFTDSSTISIGTIATWNWNFGDGNSVIKTNNNPFYHPYATTGVYTVSLITQAVNGCTSDTVKLNVSVNKKPQQHLQ
jgi:PKD repeat protein